MNDNILWKDFYIKDIFYTFEGTNGIKTPTGSYIKKVNLLKEIFLKLRLGIPIMELIIFVFRKVKTLEPIRIL